MALVNTLIVVLFVNIKFISAASFNGDECFNIKTGKSGMCTFLKECPEELAELRRRINPQQCGFEGLEVIVCCPQTKASGIRKSSVLRTRVPGEISKKKCQEYSQYVYKTVLNPTLLVNAGDVTVNDCFLERKELFESAPFAERKEFPHMAIIGFGRTEYSNLDWLCGGSLISEKHVLTAAHCTVSKSGPPQKVRLGIISLAKNDEHAQQVVVSNFVNHPMYKIRSKNHDISILFLRHNIKITAFIRPACLKTLNKATESKPIATGFAKYSVGYAEKSDYLLKSDMDIISKDICNMYTTRLHNITDEMICAENTQKDQNLESCLDSAGALQVLMKEPYCMYKVIGVPLAEVCGAPNPHNIYTNIDSEEYITWIESTVWPENK